MFSLQYIAEILRVYVCNTGLTICVKNPYDLTFCHNIFVTDDGQTDGQTHTISSTVTQVRSAKTVCNVHARNRCGVSH